MIVALTVAVVALHIALDVALTVPDVALDVAVVALCVALGVPAVASKFQQNPQSIFVMKHTISAR